MMLDKRTGVIAGENYQKASGHVWRLAFMYNHLPARWNLPECKVLGTNEGGYDKQLSKSISLPNGSFCMATNQSDTAVQGEGKSFIDLEEAATYRDIEWVAGQAQIVTHGRADVVGGSVCLVANANGQNQGWQSVRKVARVIENKNPWWKPDL